MYNHKDYFVKNNIFPTIYIITSRVGHKNYLTWNEIRELDFLGFNIQAHTHLHSDLNILSGEELLFDLKTSKDILEKKEPLTLEEKEIIKSYPYYTKKVINSIMGFSDISSLSFKAQERLDGSGIFNLSSKDLSFKDRLIICLIIYSALREQKAYREAFSHQKAIEIMQDMANNKKIDESIVDIFDKILA